MGKRLWGAILFLVTVALGAEAQNYAVNGACTLGGQATLTQGVASAGTKPLKSTTNYLGTGVMASYPGCTVTVFQTGTTSPASIYSSAAGNALSNPFTANVTDGSWLFFAAAGCYDVVLSSGATQASTMPNPKTFTGVCAGSGGGGGGGGTTSGTSVTVNGSAAVPNQLNFTNTLLVPGGSSVVNFLLNGNTVGAYVTGGGGGGNATLPTTPQWDLFASTGGGAAQASGLRGNNGFLQGQVFMATGDVNSGVPAFGFSPNGSIEYFPSGGYGLGGANGIAFFGSHSGTTGYGGIALVGGNNQGADQPYLDCEGPPVVPVLACDFKVNVTRNGASLGGGGGGGLPTIPAPNIFASDGAGGAVDSQVLGQSGFLRAYVLEATGTGNASPFNIPNGSIEYFPTGGYGAGGVNGVALHVSHSGSATGFGGIALAGGNTSGVDQLYLDCEGPPVVPALGCDFKVPNVTVMGAAIGSGPGGSGTVNSGTLGQFAWYAATGTAVSGNTHLTDASSTITSTETLAAPGLNVTGSGGIAMTGTGGTLPAPVPSSGGIGIGPGNIPEFYSNGGNWTAIGTGGTGGGVTSINGGTGAFNFTGAVSCASGTCDFTGGGGATLPTTPAWDLFASTGSGGAQTSGVLGQSGFLRAYVLEATGTNNPSPFTVPNASIEYFATGATYGTPAVTVGAANGAAIHFSHSGISGTAGNGGIALGGGNSSGVGTSYQIYLDCEQATGCDFKVPVTHLGGALGGAAAWGSITGTLSAQTDLQNAFNSKIGTGSTLTPTTCSAGQAATGILATGNATGCFTPPAGTVTGATPNMGLLLTGANLGLTNTCSAGQVLQYNASSQWVCTTATGPAGAAATIAVGTVSTGAAGSNATVTNAGTSSAAVFNFSIPQGVQGTTGATGPTGNTGATGPPGTAGTAATVTIGSTNTLAPGSVATVTNSGTTAAAILNFGIPEGQPGSAASGISGATTGGGLVVTGTSTQTLGLVTSGCTSGWTMQYNGTSWGCAAPGGISNPISFPGATLSTTASQGGFGVMTGGLPAISQNGAAYFAIQRPQVNGTSNGTNVQYMNFNDTTPASQANGLNIKWQQSGSGASISAYLPGSASGTPSADCLHGNGTWSVCATGSGTVGTGTSGQFALYNGTNSIVGSGHLTDDGSYVIANAPLSVNNILFGSTATLTPIAGTNIFAANSTGAPYWSTNGATFQPFVLGPATACTANQVLRWVSPNWTCYTPTSGTVTGATANGGLVLSGATLGLTTSGCTNGQVMQYSGTAWSCQTPTSGTVTGATTNGGLVLSGATLGLTTSGCTNGQVMQYDGTAWSCQTPTGGGSGTVGTGTTGQFALYNGTNSVAGTPNLTNDGVSTTTALPISFFPVGPGGTSPTPISGRTTLSTATNGGLIVSTLGGQFYTLRPIAINGSQTGINSGGIPFFNFNTNSPAAPANGINVTWAQNSSGQASAALVGDGSANCLSGQGTYVACGGAGGGSGTVNSGTAGQVAYYSAAGTAVSGSSALSIGSTSVSSTLPIAVANTTLTPVASTNLFSASSGAPMWSNAGATFQPFVLGPATACTANQVLRWVSPNWTCYTPTSGTVTGATASQGLSLSGATLGLQTCTNGQVLQSTGSAWNCVTPASSTSAVVTCQLSADLLAFTTATNVCVLNLPSGAAAKQWIVNCNLIWNRQAGGQTTATTMTANLVLSVAPTAASYFTTETWASGGPVFGNVNVLTSPLTTQFNTASSALNDPTIWSYVYHGSLMVPTAGMTATFTMASSNGTGLMRLGSFCTGIPTS